MTVGRLDSKSLIDYLAKKGWTTWLGKDCTETDILPNCQEDIIVGLEAFYKQNIYVILRQEEGEFKVNGFHYANQHYNHLDDVEIALSNAEEIKDLLKEEYNGDLEF